MGLSPELIKELVKLLSPLMDVPGERRALLLKVFGTELPILDEIEYGGPTDTFVTNLVRKLDEYGDVKPGKPALCKLLLTVRKKVGVDVRARIEALLNDLGYAIEMVALDSAILDKLVKLLSSLMGSPDKRRKLLNKVFSTDELIIRVMKWAKGEYRVMLEAWKTTSQLRQ
ncbi:MAG: hypothetical protein JXB47_11835, partial [Anaerolineae bacterium]|nr:hypothetical protein [Anaerolineae bacterium]